MAELEIHHEGHESDPVGKKVGIQASLLAVFLAIVTIESHRAHTETIILTTQADDQWNLYQAKKIKSHNLELGRDLISLLATQGSEPAAKKLEEYASGLKKYEQDSKEASDEARGKEKEAAAVEHKALYFDFGEGLLEIALVLSSLYFIARKMLFPVVGLIAGLLGIASAVAGLIIH
jgi:hypothetical protein